MKLPREIPTNSMPGPRWWFGAYGFKLNRLTMYVRCMWMMKGPV